LSDCAVRFEPWFIRYHVISAVLRGSCLLVIACMSFAFCQMINKEMLCFALLDIPLSSLIYNTRFVQIRSALEEL